MILKKGVVIIFVKENGQLQLGELVWANGKTLFVKDPNMIFSTYTLTEIDISGVFKFYYNPKKLSANDYLYENEEYLF